MRAEALVPTEPGEEAESTGLSVLDLVKHAALTIISTMDKNDRLAVITFSNDARVVQPLTKMDDGNKEIVTASVKEMRTGGMTNLWDGLEKAIKMFQDETPNGSVPAIMVLTDGIPNMPPAKGHIPALRDKGKLAVSIHTFGFGYKLDSGLLKSMAEVGSGNYAFIPDAGMIGTVFVHAIANLQSTFANNAVLRLEYSDQVAVHQTTGTAANQQESTQIGGDQSQLILPLGNIQYGQSRDIHLRWKSQSKVAPLYLKAELEYNRMTQELHTSTQTRSLLDTPTALSEAEVAYHISRSQICEFLAGLSPPSTTGNLTPRWRSTHKDALQSLIATIPASRYLHDTKNKSLLEDLSGQVSLALSCHDYFDRWGQHYLPSLHTAHANQLCCNFKDPGPLQYGLDSPLFLQCRDRLDAVFNTLPPPTPTAHVEHGRWRASTRITSMHSYNSADLPCFAGRTMVKLAGGKEARISSLRRGARVATPLGARKVVAVLMTPVKSALMCRVGEVLVTPWHPIAQPGPSGGTGRCWVFPAKVSRGSVRYTGAIYSVLLQRDDRVDAHAIRVGGFWGVTLGHGLLEGDDVRAHGFFGNYDAVANSLAGLEVGRNGLVLGGGVRRSKTTGLVCAFRRRFRAAAAHSRGRWDFGKEAL